MENHDQLLLDFHKQFTDNFNERQKLFVEILGAVFALFIGYGYVLDKTLNQSINEICDYRLLIIVTIAICMIASFLIIILISQGRGIRRTQKIITNIRDYFLKQGREYSREKIFGKTFGVVDNSFCGLHSLPDFYWICLIALGMFQLFASVITSIICCNFVHNGWIIALWIVYGATIVLDFLFWLLKKVKD